MAEARGACCGSTVFSTGPEAATETISSSDGGTAAGRGKHDGSFPSRLAREGMEMRP